MASSFMAPQDSGNRDLSHSISAPMARRLGLVIGLRLGATEMAPRASGMTLGAGLPFGFRRSSGCPDSPVEASSIIIGMMMTFEFDCEDVRPF